MFSVMLLDYRGLNYTGARLASVAVTLRKSNRPLVALVKIDARTQR
jgi:hypothetical protein